MNKNPSCPKCKCPEVVKNGKVQDKQRYKCKNCGFQFMRLTPRGRPASEKAHALELYTTGLSMNSIAKILNVSTTAVMKWIKSFAKATYEKPKPEGSLQIECDEMWHYIHKKKQNWDMEGL